jgi:hypothetical protein
MQTVKRQASCQMQPIAETDVFLDVRCGLLHSQASRQMQPVAQTCVMSDAACCTDRRHVRYIMLHRQASSQMYAVAQTGVTSDAACCTDRRHVRYILLHRQASRQMQPAALIFIPAVVPFGPKSLKFCVTNKHCGNLQPDAVMIRFSIWTR